MPKRYEIWKYQKLLECFIHCHKWKFKQFPAVGVFVTYSSLIQAIQVLLKGGAKAVVITSLELDNGGDLVLLGGNKKGKREREGGKGESIKMTYIIIVGEKVRLTYPKIPAPFTGTGDLFTALLLGWSEHGLQVKIHTHTMMMNSIGVHSNSYR